MKKILIPALALSLGAISCATTTKITTEEPGATLTLIDAKGEKKKLGQTPYTHESKMWIWEEEKIEVSQGAQTKTIKLSRSEFDLVPGLAAIGVTVCTGGGLICVGVPVFLAGGMKLPAETKVVFDKKTGSFIRVPAEQQIVAAAATDGAQQF